MAQVELRNVNKAFGKTEVIRMRMTSVLPKALLTFLLSLIHI